MSDPAQLKAALEAAHSQDGRSLLEISQQAPVLIVFLRHAGCTFCREALADIAAKREELKNKNVVSAVVHLGTPDEGAKMLAHYGLAEVPCISDPQQQLYRAFELRRTSFWGMLHPYLWLRFFQAGIFHGHWVGRPNGDIYQMPGAFLLYKGEILKSYRHKTMADRPDYGEMATCELPSR